MSRFPAELVLHLLYYCDPRDIIKWRTVSKGFYAITQETALWRALYKDIPFSRPPGPFPTQSRTSLERTLCKAARLSESWTTRPIRARSSVTIENVSYPRVVCGRWLVVCESQRRFILHDVDPVSKTHTQQVLCEQDTDVTSWNVQSTVSPEGDCMLYVILKFSRRLPEWQVLELRLDYDTGKLCDSAVIVPPQANSRLHRMFLLAGKSGDSTFLFIPSEPDQFVFDTRARVFYTVPALYEPPIECSWIIFSESHFISLVEFEGVTFIDILTLPDGPATGERLLCHTHTGSVEGSFGGIEPLKPTIDPTTGATNIKILDSDNFPDFRIAYLDITIPRHFPGEFLRLDSKINFLSLPGERVWPSRYEKCCRTIDVFEDGHIRGFFRAMKRERTVQRHGDGATTSDVMKFDIDTTQESWAITWGQIAPAEWNVEEDPSANVVVIGFDGIRGRLIYVHPTIEDKLVIADIE